MLMRNARWRAHRIAPLAPFGIEERNLLMSLFSTYSTGSERSDAVRDARNPGVAA
jgi:hypothetical protein